MFLHCSLCSITLHFWNLIENCISLSFCQHCSCIQAQIVRTPSNTVTSESSAKESSTVSNHNIHSTFYTLCIILRTSHDIVRHIKMIHHILHCIVHKQRRSWVRWVSIRDGKCVSAFALDTVDWPCSYVPRPRHRKSGCLCYTTYMRNSSAASHTTLVPSRDVTWHYVTLHYVTLHCIVLHYKTLHDWQEPYDTLDTTIHHTSHNSGHSITLYIMHCITHLIIHCIERHITHCIVRCAAWPYIALQCGQFRHGTLHHIPLRTSQRVQMVVWQGGPLPSREEVGRW